MFRNLHVFLSAKLAWEDLKNEFILSFCLVLGMVAVLSPLVVIAGLKVGILTNIRQVLLENPHAREIVTVSNRSFSKELLQQIANRKDVQFLIPRTRTLAASLFLEKKSDIGNGRYVMVLPTAKGDPLLKESSSFIINNNQIVLSSPAASILHLHQGEQVSAYLNRIINGNKEQEKFDLTIVAVAPDSVTDKVVAYVSLPLAVEIEAYQDGTQNWPDMLRDIQIPDQIIYSGFRLYSKNLTEIPALDASLRSMGIDIVSKSGDVAGLLSLNHRLGLLFMLIASLGGGGLCLSLGSGLWANTERKHKLLALLRLNGFSSADLIIYPMIQSIILSFCGLILTFGISIGVGILINFLFGDVLSQGHKLFLLNYQIIIATICLTLIGSMLVSLFSGKRAATIEPWDSITRL